MFVGWLNQLPLTSKGNITCDCNCIGHGTFLCELLSFTEQTVEDGTEVTEQPLAVL